VERVGGERREGERRGEKERVEVAGGERVGTEGGLG
jgi:hypothetical protein